MRADSKQTKFDVVILGGGPAGMSTAMWCADLGISALVLEERPELGGQLLWTYNRITNHLGAQAADGRGLACDFLRQLSDRDFSMVTGADVREVDAASKCVRLGDGRVFEGRFMVIATGVSRRSLDIPGEVELRGKGILESGVKMKGAVSGRRVAVIGGGDAAVENALILSESASDVFLLHRRTSFTAQRRFMDAVGRKENVKVLAPVRVTGIVGADMVRGVAFEDLKTAGRSEIEADFVLVRIGVKPNSGAFEGRVATDNAGYIEISSECETSVPGVFAAGDVAAPLSPTVSTAVGHGATVAKVIFSRIDKD